MKLRIAIWAGLGALVVVFWSLFILATSPSPLPWTLVYLTCPIALAHHYPLSVYLVLVVNAGTYALIGSGAETIRRHYKRIDLV